MVERNLAKVEVAGSSPVSRSKPNLCAYSHPRKGAGAVVQGDYQTIAVEAPGIGGASLLASGATLYDLV